MFPPQFEYVQPDSIDQAIAALASDDTRVLAGGHSLLPAMKARNASPESLVDIGDISALHRIDRDGPENETVIGAAVTDADILADGSLKRNAPMVHEAIAAVGDRQIRSRGTVVGNLLQADAGADIPAAMVAADAMLTIRNGEGERTVPVDELYEDPDNDHHPAAITNGDDLATEVRIPDVTGGAYLRKTHPATGYALVGIAVRLVTDGGTIAKARVVATGIERTPRRLPGVEERLIDKAPSSLPDQTVRIADPEPAAVRADPNVSGPYRHQLLESYTGQAIAVASDRVAPGGGENE